MDTILKLALSFGDNLNLGYTFFLLLARFTGMMMVLPGIGAGDRGLHIRYPAILVLTLASLSASQIAQLPANWVLMVVAIGSEILLGLALGLIPQMIVSGVQMAGHLTSTTMGLGAGQLIDPNMGTAAPSISIILSNITILLFLLLGGHHVVIQAVSGLGSTIVPGSFAISNLTIDLLMTRSAEIFRIGVMIASPVIVALLITNFAMGLLSKAVPTVNIFIVSFPLTIGIGLILTFLCIPEMVNVMSREFTNIEGGVLQLVADTITVK